MKKYIKILNDLELTSTEVKSLEVNIQLMKSHIGIVKKCGRDGIKHLSMQVHYRIGIMRLLTGSTIIIK